MHCIRPSACACNLPSWACRQHAQQLANGQVTVESTLCPCRQILACRGYAQDGHVPNESLAVSNQFPSLFLDNEHRIRSSVHACEFLFWAYRAYAQELANGQVPEESLAVSHEVVWDSAAWPLLPSVHARYPEASLHIPSVPLVRWQVSVHLKHLSEILSEILTGIGWGLACGIVYAAFLDLLSMSHAKRNVDRGVKKVSTLRR